MGGITYYPEVISMICFRIEMDEMEWRLMKVDKKVKSEEGEWWRGKGK
jgi:hypothetical protein